MSNSSPNDKFVVDTVALILYLEERQMGQRAKDVFTAMEFGRVTIFIPAIAASEILCSRMT